MSVLPLGELLGLVPEENMPTVLGALSFVGRAATAFLCPSCNWCGVTSELPYWGS